MPQTSGSREGGLTELAPPSSMTITRPRRTARVTAESGCEGVSRV